MKGGVVYPAGHRLEENLGRRRHWLEQDKQVAVAEEAERAACATAEVRKGLV